MPHGHPGNNAGRDPVHPCPRVAGVWRLAAAAGGARRISASAPTPSCCRRSQNCNRTGQKIARFTAVKPTETEKGLVTYLAEDAEYDNEQARDAGIQRLLAIAGYDAGPIDGVRGDKTDAALAQFIADNKLENTAAGRSDFFDLLMAAAQRPNSAGFAWCNETRNVVMAALGVEEQGAVVTRGWYRVAPGKCLRPDLTGKPRRLYSFGEAVGSDGLPLKEQRRGPWHGAAPPSCARATSSSS